MITELISIHIAKDNGRYHLSDSKGLKATVTSPETLLDFLLTDYGVDSAKCVWNLFELFAILQQQLPTEVMNKLIKEDRAWYKEYKLFSSAGKLLAITYEKPLHDNFVEPHEVNVYGLRQYFPNDSIDSLEGLTAKADELMRTLKDLQWQTSSLSSPIAIYDHAVLNKEYLPTIYDLPDTPEAIGMASYCYKMMNREIRTVYKVGHFFNATDADANAAYPSIIRNFGNTSECQIVHSTKLRRCDFGVCKGTLHINKDYSPIVNARGQNVVGSYPDIVTTEQIGYLYHYGQGTFDLEDGYFLTFDHPDDKPFADRMTDLYTMRDSGGLRKTLAKSISVGIGGKFGQEYSERYCDYFNPIYSVLMTSRCSLQVGKFIEQYGLQDSLISVAVDGCLFTKDIPLQSSKVMGEWRSEKVNALVLSIGHQYVTDNKDSGKMDAHRNTYAEMVKAMQDRPNKEFYNGVLLNSNLMATGRIFPKYPKSGKEALSTVFESKPITV